MGGEFVDDIDRGRERGRRGNDGVRREEEEGLG
jgi:hypothetical protein